MSRLPVRILASGLASARLLSPRLDGSSSPRADAARSVKTQLTLIAKFGTNATALLREPVHRGGVDSTPLRFAAARIFNAPTNFGRDAIAFPNEFHAHHAAAFPDAFRTLTRLPKSFMIAIHSPAVNAGRPTKHPTMAPAYGPAINPAR